MIWPYPVYWHQLRCFYQQYKRSGILFYWNTADLNVFEKQSTQWWWATVSRKKTFRNWRKNFFSDNLDTGLIVFVIQVGIARQWQPFCVIMKFLRRRDIHFMAQNGLITLWSVYGNDSWIASILGRLAGRQECRLASAAPKKQRRYICFTICI